VALPEAIRRATAGIVLAGGQSTRMGGADKALLMLGGKALAAHVLDRLRPQTACVAINANGDRARFASLGVPVFDDGHSLSDGPAFGVRAALDWAHARGDIAWIVTAPTDAPFLPMNLVERLLGVAETQKAAVVFAGTDSDRHPTLAAWSLTVRDQVHMLVEGDHARALHAIGDALGASVARFDKPADGRDPFFNINSPADLTLAGKWMDAG